MPDNYKYGGGVSGTVLHPLVLIAMILAVILILVLPRKYVVLPVIFLAFLTPMGQQLYVAGLHLFVLRIVILAGLIRAYASVRAEDGPRFAGGFNGIDTAFVVYIVVQGICMVLLFQEAQVLIYQVGVLWDFLGGYFVLRWLIRDEDDVYRVLKCLAIVTVPLAIGMIIEQQKMLNIFGLLGGVQTVPDVRDGKIRSQGAFAHSLMAGTLAATMIPVFFLFWRNGKSKFFGLLGFFGASAMVLTSNSSTPLMAYVASFVGLLCWPLRKSLKKVRWGIVFALAGLQLVMKAPVWFLIARVDLTGGSSSYHRAQLVDEFIRHFFDWWLLGVRDSSDWGLDMWDVQNQYVNIGETGGLLAFVFFILVISRSFGLLGNARKVVDGDKSREWMLWCLGAAMFAHVVGYIGVNYFDQSRMWWFALLAMITATCSPILQNNTSPEILSSSVQENSRLTRIKSPLQRPDSKPAPPRRPRKLEPRFR